MASSSFFFFNLRFCKRLLSSFGRSRITRQDNVCVRIRKIQISSYAFWTQKCTSNFPTFDGCYSEGYNRWYIDDISVFSPSWDTHLQHLRHILEKLCSAGLTLQLPKCSFGTQACEFLGHRVSPGYISPLQAKIKTINNFVRPVKKKDVRSFLGLAGYYRRYIPHFSTITAPLSDLTRTQESDLIVWTPDCQQAFDTLRQALSSQSILAPPDYSMLPTAVSVLFSLKRQVKMNIQLHSIPASFLIGNVDMTQWKKKV